MSQPLLKKSLKTSVKIGAVVFGTAVCEHFGVCGGCSRQNLSYAEQLAVKDQFVRACLAKLPVQTWHPILASPDVTYYRNKMEYSFGDERDTEILLHGKILDREKINRRIHVGLHPKGRFALVTPTPSCRLLSEHAQKICSVVTDWANERAVSIYVRKSGQGDLRHLVIREGKNTGERIVNLVGKSTTPHVDELAEKLKNSGLPITTFLWTSYDGLSDVAKGDDQKIYWGEGIIQEKLGGALLQVNSNSFMQTNTRAAELMIEVLKKWMVGSKLIDLYCGSGAIGLSLSSMFDEVIGIELNKDAIVDARRNAEANRISNIQFLEGKAEDLALTLPVKENAANTVVVVDPPRPGLHPTMTKTLLEWAVPQLFYVSCNPETLARDLEALSVRYDILDVQPMDFFPHTDHVETAVRLEYRATC